MLRTLSSILIVSALMLAGCVATYSGRTMTRGELTLIYDPGLQVYAVQSYPDVYYSSGLYFRYSSGYWVESRSVSGPWEPCSDRQVPRGLREGWDQGNGRHQGHDRDWD